MKSLLEFYNESIQEGPALDINSFIKKYPSRVKKLESVNTYISSIYSRSLQDISNYNFCSNSDYFGTINGNKVIVCRDYVGVIDIWFPTETLLFDLTSPIISGWLISEINREGNFNNIEEVVKYPHLIESSLSSLVNTLTGMTVWGFWLGDQRRATRERGLKIREFEVVKAEVPPNNQFYGFYSFPLEITLYDKCSKKDYIFNSYDKYRGWNFYLSKELLSNKLNELEVVWTRGYDTKVKHYEHEIARKSEELENLKHERLKYELGIEEFRKKIHDKLWKSF